MIRALTLLLILQLGIIVALYGSGDGGTPSPEAFLALSVSDIEEVHISDGDKDVQLRRDNTTWTVAGLPADASRVQPLLAALRQDPGFRIADSRSAATRFAVAEDHFERRIDLRSAEVEARVYLGNAPSFGKTHARRDGEDAVYALDLNSFDAPADLNSWLDRSLLARPNPASLALYGSRFDRRDEGWEQDDGTPVDSEVLEPLLDALARLQVSGVAEAGATEGDSEETLQLTVDGSELRLLHDSDGDRYFLQSDQYDRLFDLSAMDGQRLLDGARALGENPSPAT